MQVDRTKTAVVPLPDTKAAPADKPRLAVPDHELIRRIGEGSYGEVWLARNVLGGYRAVKAVFRASFKTDEPYEREFHGIQRFEPISRTNDGLVDILQVGRNDAEGCFYYVMELADDAAKPRVESYELRVERPGTAHGDSQLSTQDALNYVPRTLRSEIQCRGRLPPDECVRLGLNLSLTLAHLHRNGLIHRDIKPANIIFVGGIPKLADIGLVTDLSDARSFVGTEGFMPPEGPNTPQADIYSLGKVLYEIGMGKDRKDFPEPATLLGDSEDSEQLEELNAVILKACASNPADRYQTAEELNADLALLNSGKSVKWKRVVERRLDWAKRIIGVAAGIAALAVGGYLFQRQQTREAQRNLYAANLNLAQRDWDKANVDRISTLLTETENYPDKGFEWYYWQRQLHLDRKTLRGHSNAVGAVAFSPDGQRLVTGSADHSAIVWDVASGLPLNALNGHTSSVSSVAFMPDGRRIVTGSDDRTVRIWDAADGRQLKVLSGHTGSVLALAISPDGKQIVTASLYSSSRRDIMIAVWDADSGGKLQVLGGKPGMHGLSCVALSPDGRRIAAITDQFAVKIWDTASGREVLIPSPFSEFASLAFSADGQRLLTGSGRVAAVWDASTGEQLFFLQAGNERGPIYVAYSPDGKKIATAGKDQRVILWDAATGKELFRLAGHRGAIESVAFSPDSKSIVTASADGTVKIWDAYHVQNPRTLPNRTKEVHALAITSDGKLVVTAMWDKTVRITEIATGREVLALTGYLDEVKCIAFSPDGRRIATGNGWTGPQGQERAKIWDTSNGRELLALNGSGLVAFSPDGQRLATSSGTCSATIWNASSGAKLVELNGHSNWVHSAAFSPDGKRIVTSSEDWTVKLWDAATGRELLSIQRPKHSDQNLSSVIFSPDGKRIALANNDQTPRIWDASTGREVLALKGHTDMVTCISWSPDGKRVLTSGYDRTPKIWDARTGRELLTLEVQVRAVAASAFSPDGKSIVTAGLDGLTKVWEAASVAQVTAWREEEEAVKDMFKASGH